MKRFAFISLLILEGCSMAVPEEADPQVLLAFQPVVCPMTKEAEHSEFTVGVSAWTLAEGESWEYEAPGQVYLSNSRVIPGQEDLWYLEDMGSWPSREERLSVIGYAPFEAASGCDAEFGVRFEDVNVLELDTALFYTEPQTDLIKTSSGGVVPLPMQQALCQMDFKVRTRVSAEEKITVRKITLDDACYTGDFRSLPDPQWKVSGMVSDVEFYQEKPRLMIPQCLNSPVTVEFEYTNPAGLSITQSLKTSLIEKELYPGMHYTYILSVGMDEVKFLLEIL